VRGGNPMKTPPPPSLSPSTGGEKFTESSMGRFIGTVVPIYLVLGRLLQRAPPGLDCMLLALSSLLMGVYAALLSAWYPFY
jgi:hypothetical protein